MIRRTLHFVFDNSLPLILGAVSAMLWANLDGESYQNFLHIGLPAIHWPGRAEPHSLDLHFLVNDVLMAFFFALAGREVWDALLPGGALSSPRRAATPILCAVGGMVGPAAIFLAGAAAVGQIETLGEGWAIPTATDIAFSYLIARVIFGAHHPAVRFLLMLAIVDDALGLLILAVFYPQESVQLAWLGLSAGAVAVGLAMWKFKVRSYGWYLLIPGALSWMGFLLAGLHPALGLLPVVGLIPHVHIHKDRLGWDFLSPSDQHKFETQLKGPVELILGLFGLMNAGVAMAAVSPATLLVLAGLLVGKPLGIWLSAVVGVRVLRFKLDASLSLKDIFVLGCAAGVGFTVALFVCTVAFEAGPVQESAKMGALASVGAAGVAWIAARCLGIRPMVGMAREDSHV